MRSGVRLVFSGRVLAYYIIFIGKGPEGTDGGEGEPGGGSQWRGGEPGGGGRGGGDIAVVARVPNLLT